MVLFSIIIPLYNKENAIEKTLKSIFNQSITNYEVIVINDGSTDAGEEIVKKISDKRLRLISTENKGVSHARNLGISESKGELIAFLDADDYWFPNHLEVLHKLILENPDSGIYASRYITKVSENKFLTNNFLNIPDNYSGIVPDFFYSSLKNRIAITSAVAVPKAVLAQIGAFNLAISSGQDLDLWIRIANVYSVAITNKVTMEYDATDLKSLSKTTIQDKKLIDFSEFNKEEQNNKSLKAFLDINRMDYALKFKISGDLKTAKEYYNAIAKENITVKNWLVFHLPRWIQILLLKFKKKLYKNGIEFSVYR